MIAHRDQRAGAGRSTPARCST